MTITDEHMREVLQQAKPYTIAILTAGPNAAAADRPAIVWEHGRRNMSLRESGAMPIVCPINDGSGVHGVSIFDRSVEETKAIMDADPGVQAGIFVYELHPCRGFPGSVLP